MTNRRRIAFVLSNPAISSVTGWPIGFWLAELTHPYAEFERAGFEIELFSPEGGALTMDDYSDPYAENGYSADDEISKAFLADPAKRALLDSTRPLDELVETAFDTVFLVGGQGPMETFRRNAAVEAVVREFHAAGKPTVVVCHATCVLLDARDAAGTLLVDGQRWTGFTSEEEAYVEQNVGQKFQPFWIEEEAKRIPGTTFVAGPAMQSHAVRSGNLITGQQQHSGAEAARLAIGMLA
jgi:putative intracellular protease/amidase